jgi:hypothetical protein
MGHGRPLPTRARRAGPFVGNRRPVTKESRTMSQPIDGRQRSGVRTTPGSPVTATLR